MGALTQAFRGAVSQLKDFRMKSEAGFGVGYSTGFLNFDFKNGTVVHVKSESRDFRYYSIGITDGSMVMIIGRSGCGKTTWAIQAAANIIRPFKTSCVFEDNIEGGVTINRKEILTKFYGDDLDDRFISRDTGITGENFFERVKMIYDLKVNNRELYEYDTGLYDNRGNRVYKLEPTVYLLDSLALLMPSKYTDEDELSGQMAATAAAKSNTSIFKRIIPMLKSANIILFIINHITTNMSISAFSKPKAQVSYLKQDEALPGGKAAIYLSNNIIRFDDNSKLKADEVFGIDGSMVDLTLIKSRNNKAGQTATLVFDQDTGFDSDLSLYILLKQNGKIKGAGVSFYIDGFDEYKFSQKTFKHKLATIPEFQEIFINTVLEVLQDSIYSIEETEYSETNDIASMVMSRMNPIMS